MKTQATKFIGGLLLASLTVLPGTLQAQAHYPAGVEGVKAASLPPPGFYARDYNYFYWSDNLKIKGGPPNADLFAYIQAPRLIWISDFKVLGGFYGADVLVPFAYQNLKVGDKVKGKVVVIADYGAFVEIATGVEGLIHVSEMSWSQHLRTAQDFLKVGQEVEAVILTLDREERKMSMGIKQLIPENDTYKSRFLAAFFGVKLDNLDNLPAEKYRLFAEVSAINFLTKDDPPVLQLYGYPLDAPITDQNIGIHHPRFGQFLKTKMDALGIPCELTTKQGSGHTILTFIKKHFGIRESSPGR